MKNNLNKKLLAFKIKNILITLLNLSLIFLIAYLFNRWFEMLVFTLTYNIIRCEFTKAVHGNDFTTSHNKAIRLCRLITFIVQFISIIFLMTINLSKYLNIFLACVLGIINFILKYYIEREFSFELKLRNEKDLKKLCNDFKISQNAYNRLYMRYIQKLSISEIADIECVDELSITQSIRRSRKKIKGGN